MAKEPAKQPEEKGGSKKLLIIMIAVGLVILIGAGAGAFFFLNGGDGKSSHGERKTAAVLETSPVGPMVNIDPFIVNILDNEESRYLKAAITIEVDSDTASMELTSRMAQIKDAILLLVGNKTFNELSDLQGKLQLRAELLNKLNSILVQGKAKRIYFTDFVVQ